MKKEQLTKLIKQLVNEELGYMSIASNHYMPYHAGSSETGFNNPPIPQPREFEGGSLDVHDSIDNLSYHFSVPQILDALADSLMAQSQAQGNSFDVDRREALVDIAGKLKTMVKQLKY